MSDSITIALIGISGAVIGSVATIAGNVLMHWLNEKSNEKKEKPAKDLLITMLTDEKYTWRNLDTLMHVIGSDEEKTKMLLLEVGTRASEDGQPKWALLSRAPLSSDK